MQPIRILNVILFSFFLGSGPSAEETGFVQKSLSHTVVRGDTLYSVARQYGLDYEVLAVWNDIDSSFVITPGQRLNLEGSQAPQLRIIPSSTNMPPHTVIRGDTLYSIAKRYGLDYEVLAVWNDIDSSYVITPGEKLNLEGSQSQQRRVIPSATDMPSHTVIRGDTLYSVAKRYGLDYEALAIWNDIDSSYVITQDQRLRLRQPNRSTEELSPRKEELRLPRIASSIDPEQVKRGPILNGGNQFNIDSTSDSSMGNNNSDKHVVSESDDALSNTVSNSFAQNDAGMPANETHDYPELDWEITGYVGIEARVFARSPAIAQQHEDNLSFIVQPEFYTEWDDGRQSLLITPYLRWDQGDDRRSHFDVREFTWLYVSDFWELNVGIRKVFWGVVESQHLVDIINQWDLVDNLDGEDKLGQPMINLSVIQDWGTLDFFVLPYFRERTFAGPQGRIRPLPRIATGLAEYESAAEEHHVDFAIRWSHAIGDWDLGLSHFYGTSREPIFFASVLPTSEIVLIPRYHIIHQTGLDLQATKGDWLWKLEVIQRSGQEDSFVALTGGFEYTRVGIFDTQMDLGFLLEYLFDDRKDRTRIPFQNDVLGGFRLSLNDEQSTAILMGAMVDRDDQSWSFNLEASRRIGDRWTVEAEARFFENLDQGNLQFAVKDDDYIQIQLSRFF